MAVIGVSSLASDDVWAVGYGQRPLHPVALHWNGHRWAPYNVESLEGGYLDVAINAPDDVWAVGFDFSHHGRALIEHWDGSSWTQVEGPTVSGGYFGLDSLGFLAPDDGYAFGKVTSEKTAVGRSTPSDDDIILHWDGTSWTDVSQPDVHINALDAISRDDAWRVGMSATGVGYTEHWDGSSWKHVPCPTFSYAEELESVTMLAPDDVWAAGNSAEGPFTLHWNGTRWRVFPEENRLGVLLGISGEGRGPVWSVGTNVWPGPPRLQRWAGHEWVTVDDPLHEEQPVALSDVTAISRDDAWVVGDVSEKWHGATYSRRILMHWNGESWTRYQSPRG